jgi:hypothetical protein
LTIKANYPIIFGMTEKINSGFPNGFIANIETVFLAPQGKIQEQLVKEYFQMQTEVSNAKLSEGTVGFATAYGVSLGALLGLGGAGVVSTTFDPENYQIWTKVGMSAGSAAGAFIGGIIDAKTYLHNQNIKQLIYDKTKAFSNRVWEKLDDNAKNTVNQWAVRLRKK